MVAAKSKVRSSKSGNWGSLGGSGHMVGKQSAGQQKPGQTADNSSGGGKFAKGGSGKMVGKQQAKQASPA